MIHFVLLISRQGKVRLTKWYTPYPQKQRSKVYTSRLLKEMLQQITSNLPQYMGSTSLHLGSTMTMAVGAKLFMNASSTGHQTISDERHRREKWQLEIIKEISTLVLTRGPKLCNFVDWQGYRVVYKRYASLYFCMCIDPADNELETLQIIHHYVEILDRYFGNVCELDLIFNFHKAYFILDDILIAGELQESNKKSVLRLVTTQDALVEAAKEEAGSLRNIIAQATK